MRVSGGEMMLFWCGGEMMLFWCVGGFVVLIIERVRSDLCGCIGLYFIFCFFGTYY